MVEHGLDANLSHRQQGSVVAGVSGVLGLSFTWHRALVVYTLSAWLALAFTVWQIANLALRGDQCKLRFAHPCSGGP